MILLLLLACYACGASEYEDVEEICDMETFEAVCPDGSVVVLDSARYGRMRNTHCVSERTSYIGCWADVLPEADLWCSGRPSCHIPVPNSAFRNARPCPVDLTSYLEIAYHCQPVVNVSSVNCSRFGHVSVTLPSGFLSKQTMLNTGVGSYRCPVIIHALPGQIVNITMTDFASSASSFVNVNDQDAGLCHVTSVVREMDVEFENLPARTACRGSGSRLRHLYTSSGSSVSVKMLGRRRQNQDEPLYLLQWESIGCSSYVAPRGFWSQASGDDRTLVGCLGSSRYWTLDCHDNGWTGSTGRCDDGIRGLLGSVIGGSIMVTGNVSAMVMAGAAVVLVVAIVAICVVCTNCCRKRKLLHLREELPEAPACEHVNGSSLHVVNKYASPAESPPNVSVRRGPKRPLPAAALRVPEPPPPTTRGTLSAHQCALADNGRSGGAPPEQDERSTLHDGQLTLQQYRTFEHRRRKLDSPHRRDLADSKEPQSTL